MTLSDRFEIFCIIDLMPKVNNSFPIKESFVRTKNLVQTCD